MENWNIPFFVLWRCVSFRKIRAYLLVPVFLLFLTACAEHIDPTQIFAAQAPLLHGVNLTIYRSGDPNNTPIIHVWVESSGDTVNVKTLLTTNGGAQLSCAGPNFCPCEGPTSAGGNGYWSLFCKTNGNVFPPTDANSSATQSYPFDRPLYFAWDWTDHLNQVVANGTYVIHAEVSGYYYGSPGEASITVVKNASAGSTTGQADGGQWKAISADWNP